MAPSSDAAVANKQSLVPAHQPRCGHAMPPGPYSHGIPPHTCAHAHTRAPGPAPAPAAPPPSPTGQAGDRAVKALEKRLQLGLTETQCVQHVLQLIADSLDAWRTRQYDAYQRVLNGIL